ncbi:MAG: hypoxanthine phosphoribosyltransferase [Desulfobulbaceae bacterium]|nr:hypoxanthine phosphoribosyltransferase [Desulfobulbaceae bacterium]
MLKKKKILGQDDIRKRTEELGQQITADFKNLDDLILIGVLKGSFVFMADLMRSISLPLQIDFIRVASYGKNHTSSETITLTKDVEISVEGKNILLIEDIIDTGLTLSFLKKYFLDQKVKTVQVCTLINKKERRKVEIQADYTGFEIADGFLVGYGLDYAEQYRHLPDIYQLEMNHEHE